MVFGHEYVNMGSQKIIKLAITRNESFLKVLVSSMLIN